jgi:hypothetical protein
MIKEIKMEQLIEQAVGDYLVCCFVVFVGLICLIGCIKKNW